MGPSLDTFSPMWWQTSGISIVLTVLVLIAIGFLKPAQRAASTKVLGWILVSWMIVPPFAHAFAGYWRVEYGLPLQWCDFTGGVAGWALLTRRQALYEIALYWGITGAATALLTPQFTQGTTWFFITEFFVSHSILLTAPFFLSVYENMRPRPWSWLRALGWLNAAALAVGAFDYLVDANYMFLFVAPAGGNPLFQLQWPYYLIGFEIGCLLLFVLIYLPFRLTSRAPPNPGSSPSVRGAVRMERSEICLPERTDARA